MCILHLMRRWGILLFITLFLVPVMGQDSEMYFKSFTIDDGLSQNSVYAIAQTQEGFIWAGTIDGLNRFDGKRFRSYYPEQGEGNTKSSIIYSLLVIEDHLLVGTSKGLLIFDTDVEEFQLPETRYPKLTLPNQIGVKEIFEDDDSNLWILTLSDGVFRYDVATHQIDNFLSDEERKNKVSGICKTQSGGIYLATEDKIFTYNQNTLVETTFDLGANEANKIRSITSIEDDIFIGVQNLGLVRISPSENFKVDYTYAKHTPHDIEDILGVGNHELWIGSRSQGVFLLDIERKSVNQGIRGDKLMMLKSNFVLSLFRDSKDKIWLGLSGGGLSYHLEDVTIFENITPNELSNDSEGDNMIFGIYQLSKDVFYLGSLNKGLKEYNRAKKSIEYHIDRNLPIEMSNIYAIKRRKNLLWLATWGGLCTYDLSSRQFGSFTSKEDNPTKLYSIFPLDANRFLLGGENGLIVYNINSERFEPFMPQNKILEDVIPVYIDRYDESNILVCSSNASIIKVNLETKESTVYPAIQNIAAGARHFYLGKEECWIATEGGLVQLDKKTMKVKKVWTTKDGLSNHFIYAVHGDRNGDIWFTSNKGLSQIIRSKNKVVNYGLANGLQSLEFNSASCLFSKQEELFFGGINGMNIIQPVQAKSQSIPRTPQITKISVMNKSLITDSSHTELSQLTLQRNERLLSFEFVSPDHFKSNDINYSYKLDGVDEEWIDLGQRTSINFSHLGPGEYTFGVRANDKNGNISPENNKLKITVLPQFWQTWWFRILTFILLAAIIFLFWYNSIKSIEKKHKFEEQISKLELSALRSQMNPHFIFNTLNSIKYHSIYKSRDETSEYIVEFSSLIRKILENSKHLEISLRQEIEIIELYVNLEKRRMKKEFQFDLNIDGKLNIDNYSISPMIIQPFIENAIWHGLMNKEGEKVLKLSFKKKEDGFICVVDDNGVGRQGGRRDNNKKNSLGISITEDRMSKLNSINDTQNTIEIIDKVDKDGNPKGTRVIINMTKQIA